MQIVNAEKKIVAPLIEECTETVEEVKLTSIIFAENENKSSYKYISCKWYIVLLLTFFTINVSGIVTYYVWNCYLLCLFTMVFKKYVLS